MDSHAWSDLIARAVAVAAVIMPAIWWLVRKIERNREVAIKEYLHDSKQAEEVHEIDVTLHTLHAQSEHMAKVQQEILEAVHTADRSNVRAHVALVKSLAAHDPMPLTIFKFEDGNYEYLWGNKAWHDMVGLSPDEARAGAEWDTVHPDERTKFTKVAVDVADRAESFNIGWTLVDAVTQQVKGHVDAWAEMMPGEYDGYWYYLTTYEFTPLNGTDSSSTRGYE